MMFYIQNYDFYRTDSENGHKGRTPIAVKKRISHTCVVLPPLLSVETTEVCVPFENTEIFLAAIYKSPQRW
jgi:hypothetical protein